VSPRSSELLEDAWSAPPEEARRAIDFAERFLTAIEALVG
jgi:hypothetical protein